MKLSSISTKLTTTAIIALLFVPTLLAVAKVKSYAFKGGSDGAYPDAPLIEDAAGNFYGTAVNGGQIGGTCSNPFGCGSVFKLWRNGSGAWSKATIYTFTGATDGAYPGWLTFSPSGSIYGTANDGGTFGYGVVFELTPAQDGTWSEKTVYSFQGGANGSQPAYGVILDTTGNLYGITGNGGICGQSGCGGVLYELTPNQTGSWTESIPYQFPLNQNGYSPRPNPIAFHAGSIYGTTIEGGIYTEGSVYQLNPGQGGAWTETDLYSFEGGFDGGNVGSGVTFDDAGNIYGETEDGGSFACPISGCGVIFELAPNSDGSWKESTAYTFRGLNGRRGQYPYGGLTLDNSGNLYGTTNSGGTGDCGGLGVPCGTIFELSTFDPESSFRILGSFNGVDGANPTSAVIVDAEGIVYGAVEDGGDLNCNPKEGFGCGTVFELSP